MGFVTEAFDGKERKLQFRGGMHGGLQAWRVPCRSNRRCFQQRPLRRAVQARLGPFFHRLARLGHSHFGTSIFQLRSFDFRVIIAYIMLFLCLWTSITHYVELLIPRISRTPLRLVASL